MVRGLTDRQTQPVVDLVARDRAIDALCRVGADDPQFAGVAIGADQKSLLLYRAEAETELPSSLDAAYRACLPDDLPMSYRTAALSLMQVDELRALVSAHLPAFAAAGMKVNAWGQRDGLSDPFTIYYSEGGQPPASLARVFDLFGTGTVEFAQGGVVRLEM